MHFFVHSAYRAGIVVVLRRVGYRPAPQPIIDGNQAARPQERQAALVIVAVVDFVRVDKGEIETAGRSPLAQEGVQGFHSRTQTQVDLVGDAGLGPVAEANGGENFADIAGDDAAVGGQGKS